MLPYGVRGVFTMERTANAFFSGWTAPTDLSNIHVIPWTCLCDHPVRPLLCRSIAYGTFHENPFPSTRPLVQGCFKVWLGRMPVRLWDVL